MKLKSYILSIAAAAAGAGFLGSCEDMLEPTSQYVIYDDGSHLNTPADTANSLIGIIYKLQAIGDRTHLLGEVRGDFVNVLQSADADLQDLYNFNVGDDNIYNNPRDYYAVINNCNYFIANADTNAYDNRGNRIFEKEMAQVKAIRAWTYLQLVLNYGRVPFYDRPLLTEQDAGNVSLADADRKDIEGICNYFIPDLLPYSLTEWPQLHTVGSIFMPNCYFPVDMVLGDLYLWRASVTGSRSDYREAARCYFRWIMDTRNVGDGRYKSPYVVSWSTTVEWYRYTSSLTGTSYISSDSYSGNLFGMASSLYGNETFTIIPMDSAASQGYYNKVRDLYNNAEVVGIGTFSVNPEVRYSITPSAHIQEISAAQSYYYLGDDGNHYPVVVDEDDALREGDLRLFTVWSSGTYNTTTGGMASNASWQYIEKVANRNIPVYRKTDCWLRLAEALNGGGYPRLAYAILATGISEDIVNDSVLAYCSESDAAFIRELDGLGEGYNFRNFIARNGVMETGADTYNNIGLHSRGSGYAELNPDYAYPMVDSLDAEGQPVNGYQGQSRVAWAQENLAAEQLSVDSMILNEMALETCFEGKRFYDLMRFAKRYHKNEWLADPVSKRNGEENQDMALYNLLMTESNWYMNWKNQIGM